MKNAKKQKGYNGILRSYEKIKQEIEEKKQNMIHTTKGAELPDFMENTR